MSFPFGGHPTLGQYMAAARDAGFVCESGVIGTVAVVYITSPNGYVFLPMGQKELLAPSMVDYLDRRLDWDSPFDGAPKYRDDD